MNDWFSKHWQQLRDCRDLDELVAGPKAAVTALALLGNAVLIGVAPFLSSHATRLNVFASAPVGLFLMGLAGLAFLVVRAGAPRGGWAVAANWVGTLAWTSALVYESASSRGIEAAVLAGAHALVLVVVMAPAHSLCLGMALGWALPELVLLPLLRPSIPISGALLSGLIMALLVSRSTSLKRTLAQSERELKAALRTVDHVAAESTQAALGAMSHRLGRFLHGLRNYQTSIGANLAYLETALDLEPEARAALLDAKQAQGAELELVRETIEEMRQRVGPAQTLRLFAEAIERQKRLAPPEALNETPPPDRSRAP